MAERNVKVFQELPVGLRKPAGPMEVQNYQHLCRAFELALNLLKGMVSEATYQKHYPTLRDAFFLKVLDSSLLAAVDDCRRPWNIDSLPEFSNVITASIRRSQQEACIELMNCRCRLLLPPLLSRRISWKTITASSRSF